MRTETSHGGKLVSAAVFFLRILPPGINWRCADRIDERQIAQGGSARQRRAANGCPIDYATLAPSSPEYGGPGPSRHIRH